MLKMNLLTERRDARREAENAYRKMRSGAEVVDYLAMHLDTTVRRRLRQNIRNDKKRPALLAARATKRALKLDLQMSRRKGMTLGPELLGRSLGQPNRDVEVGKPKPTGKDRFQQWSTLFAMQHRLH
jgi:hypothetical protein